MSESLAEVEAIPEERRADLEQLARLIRGRLDAGGSARVALGAVLPLPAVAWWWGR